MLYLVVAGLLALLLAIMILLAIGAGSDADHMGDGPTRRTFTTWALVFGIVLAGWTILNAATTVSPRAVGIQTAFGKYVSTMPAGFHWTSPWSGVEEFPTQVQFLELNSATDKGKGGVEVNYQGGGKGVVDATVRWRIDDKNAEDLWRKYRDFDKVRDQLVLSSSRDSLRVIVGGYAPNDARAGENLRKITGAAQTDLGNQLRDDGVRIDSISVTGVFLDDATQRSIEQIVQAEAAVKKAEADRDRAKIDNETANLRAKSAALSAGALQRYCLDVTNSWDQSKNGPLPATWSCLVQTPVTPTIGVGQR